MVDIRAFRGTLYNPEKIVDMNQVTAPPYDVISPSEREEFEQAHEKNVVRLILSQEQDGDTDTSNKYTRAKDLLNEWLKDETLIIDEKDALYVYEQRFTINGQTFSRTGFITRVKLEEFSAGVILPHEKTYAKAKTDRHNLLRTAETNFSQVFSLYQDQENRVDAVLASVQDEAPLYDLTDEDNIQHRLWRLSAPDRIKAVQDILKDKRIFIADGHHRYESSLNYRNEMRELNPGYTGEESFNFTMMMLVSMSNPGLIILPTHRMLNEVADFNLDDFRGRAKKYFEIEKIPCTSATRLSVLADVEEKIERLHRDHHVFCLYTGNEYVFLTLISEAPILEQVSEPRSDQWKKLDVTMLHHFILKKLLNYDPAPGVIKYTPRAKELVAKVDNGDFQIGFIVAPTRIGEVREIASSREIMPQKSTYFYPKLLSGLVINKHQAEILV